MGKKDVPLNEIGIKQANDTASLLDNYIFDLIICSPLIRAVETANIINEKRNLNIIFDERLSERSLGNLEGKPYTSDNDQLWDISINLSVYGEESMTDFKNRVYCFLDEIYVKYNNLNILIVTHGGVTALINCYFNDSLYDGSISNKFLNNCEYDLYDFSNNFSKKRIID